MKLAMILSWVFWGMVGLVILYLASGRISERLTLQRYQDIFSRAQHPLGTTMLDSIGIQSAFYPATYAGEFIGFTSAVIIAELRQYMPDTWTDVELFYHRENRLEDGTPIVSVPLEIQHRPDRKWLAVVDGFFLDPSADEVVLLIQEHYGTPGVPKNLIGTEQNLYLVYSLWMQDDGR